MNLSLLCLAHQGKKKGSFTSVKKEMGGGGGARISRLAM